ncbi:MAG: hypothetical protein ABR564_06525, partial [Candidatus Dormibacteria bacterium]
ERCRRYPGVAFRDRESRRRAWLIGTSMDLWQISRGLEDFGGDVERMAAETDLTMQQIQLAAAYRNEFAEEIDSAIAADRRGLGELRDQYPFIPALSLE